MNTDADRSFWSRLDRSTEHWRWRGALKADGYGQLRFRGRVTRAHRAAWTLAYGPIPHGLYVCHRCDERDCCNPGHLFLGSAADNMRDMASKGRMAQQARPETRMRGERHYRAKLSDGDVAAIRAACRTGLSQAKVADMFGVCQQHISDIVHARRRRS